MIYIYFENKKILFFSFAKEYCFSKFLSNCCYFQELGLNFSCRFTYLRTGSDRYDADGLNSLHYKLLNVSKHKLFTTFTVGINEDEVMKDFQVTDMPPGLFVEDESVDDNMVDEGNKHERIQMFYTVVKQSDIQTIIENLKIKAQERKVKKNVLLNSPESGMADM